MQDLDDKREAAEGHADITAVLEDVFLWVSQAGTPEAPKVKGKGILIKDRGAFIGVGCTRF